MLIKNTARLRFWLLLGLIVVALASSAWGVLRSGDWGGFALNLGTEMGGAVITYALFELVIRRSEEREEEKEDLEALKADLIARMGSQVNDVAVAATEELRRREWLRDGSLRGADLKGANLAGANLQGARLRRADLREASLAGADLRRADLREADLDGANLRGANLHQAMLYDAYLQGAADDRSTVLPDGGRGGSNTDWARFTGSRRPDSERKQRARIRALTRW